MKVTWSDTGDESFEDLKRYLRSRSAAAAEDWTPRIDAAVAAAADAPRTRRMVPEVQNDHIREALVGPYRVWYRIYDSEDRIDVLLVVHGARQVR